MSLVTYHTSACTGKTTEDCIPGERHSFGPLFSGGPAGFFSDYNYPAITGRTIICTGQRVRRLLLLRHLDEPKLDQPKPTLVGPELVQSAVENFSHGTPA